MSITSTKTTTKKTKTKELVLIGGGHAHVHVLKMLGMPEYKTLLQNHGINVTCISRDVFTPYSGMLPGYIAGHYTHDDMHLNLMKLCEYSNIKLIHASVTEIVPNNENATSSGGGYVKINNDDSHQPVIRYDCLSINVGSAPSSSSISLSSDGGSTIITSSSAHNHPRIIPVKPISQFSKYYETLIERIECIVEDNLKKGTSQQHTIAIVGGGAGGVELACSIQYKIQQLIRDKMMKKCPSSSSSLVVEPIDLKMIILTRGNTILNEHNWLVRKLYQRVLTERNIEVQYNTEVVGTTKTTSASTGSNNGIGVVELTINKVTSSSNKAEDEDDDTTIITTTDNNNDNNDNNNNASSTTATATTRTLVVDDCLWCTSPSGTSW